MPSGPCSVCGWMRAAILGLTRRFSLMVSELECDSPTHSLSLFLLLLISCRDNIELLRIYSLRNIAFIHRKKQRPVDFCSCGMDFSCIHYSPLSCLQLLTSGKPFDKPHLPICKGACVCVGRLHEELMKRMHRFYSVQIQAGWAQEIMLPEAKGKTPSHHSTNWHWLDCWLTSVLIVHLQGGISHGTTPVATASSTAATRCSHFLMLRLSLNLNCDVKEDAMQSVMKCNFTASAGVFHGSSVGGIEKVWDGPGKPPASHRSHTTALWVSEQEGNELQCWCFNHSFSVNGTMKEMVVHKKKTRSKWRGLGRKPVIVCVESVVLFGTTKTWWCTVGMWSFWWCRRGESAPSCVWSLKDLSKVLNILGGRLEFRTLDSSCKVPIQLNGFTTSKSPTFTVLVILQTESNKDICKFCLFFTLPNQGWVLLKLTGGTLDLESPHIS